MISTIPSENEIKNAPKIVADLLANFIDKRRNMGVLCGVLNLDKNYELRAKMLKNKAQSGLNPASSKKSPNAQKGLIYESEYTPHFMLCALAVQ